MICTEQVYRLLEAGKETLLGVTGPGFSWQVTALDVTDSTNVRIRQAAREGAAQGLVITAEGQTAGRGRRGRSWASPAGENLYFSILLRPAFSVEQAPMLTLVMALAVTAALREAGFEAQIKWPNDVVIAKRKVCGILTELYQEQNGYYVVIGVGINVNQRQFLPEIAKTATSLSLCRETVLGREEILAAVLRQFAFYYGQFIQTGDFKQLKEPYEAWLANRGAQVTVLDPKGSWDGIAEGITDTGELIVRRADGSIETVYAGEVSVRGIYGYV